jgi:hypothetical protein
LGVGARRGEHRYNALSRAFWIWGAHAPSRVNFGALTEISLGKKFVIAGRDHQHARRVRSPETGRRLSIPNHRELAKGTLRALIREAGLTKEQFAELL